MFYTCPKDPGHQSTDSDYCSVCGAKITGLPGAVAPPATILAQAPVSAFNATPVGDVCPDCGAPHTPGGKFCEVCRYNFETGTSMSAGTVPPVVVSAPEPAPTMPDPVPVTVMAPPPIVAASPAPNLAPPEPVPVFTMPAPTDASLTKWEAVVTVDCSLYHEPDPNVPCPTGEPERSFPLDFAENLIGRRSDRKDIHPEIPLSDPGVSHRHAKLLRAPDGGFVLLDVGSTNGTQLNGVDIKPGVRTPVGESDIITLGCWTSMSLRRSSL